MNDNDKKRFGVALAALAQCYEKELSLNLQKIYWLVIRDEMSIDQFEAATFAAMRQLQWFPKPAELIKLVEGNLDDIALEAWATLVKAIDEHGGYKSIKFKDQVLAATIESCGGWQYICGLKIAEFESFFRQRFIDTYKSFNRRGIKSEAPSIGIHEQTRKRLTQVENISPIGRLVGSLVEKLPMKIDSEVQQV